MAASASAQDLFARFDRRAKRLENLGLEASRLHRKARVTQGNVDAIYESALLNMVTAFELFLEDLFYSVLLGTSQIAGSGGGVTFKDRAQAEAILLSGSSYLSWLPFDKHVVPRGDRLLVESPFSRLKRQKIETDQLENVRVIRNAIAHESGTAKSSFSPLAANLRPGRRTPAALLQDLQQGDTRHVIYSTQLRVIARALAAPSLKDAKQLLTPETPYDRGTKPPRGVYACKTCTATMTISARKPALTRCPVCFAARRPAKQYERVY